MKKGAKIAVGVLAAALVAAGAASREQAERAVSLIGDNCRLIETDNSEHVIHTVHKDFYIDAVNSMHP